MKKVFLSLAAVSSMLIAVSSCNNSTSEKATTAEAQKTADATGEQYSIDTTSSVVGWRATHKGGLAPRFGTLKVQSGAFAVENSAITGGSFVVDLNTLYVDPKSVTESDKKPEDLAKHLQSPDFFDVAKFPTVKFDITKVEAFDSATTKSSLPGATNTVSGNLTIKGNTVNVTFPAKITLADGKATIDAQFTVDRTTWGLKYGADGTNPADWAISKDIELTLHVTGDKK